MRVDAIRVAILARSSYERLKTFRIYLKATAGMRIIDKSSRDQIMLNIRNGRRVFPAALPFPTLLSYLPVFHLALAINELRWLANHLVTFFRAGA